MRTMTIQKVQYEECELVCGIGVLSHDQEHDWEIAEEDCDIFIDIDYEDFRDFVKELIRQLDIHYFDTIGLVQPHHSTPWDSKEYGHYFARLPQHSTGAIQCALQVLQLDEMTTSGIEMTMANVEISHRNFRDPIVLLCYWGDMYPRDDDEKLYIVKEEYDEQGVFYRDAKF